MKLPHFEKYLEVLFRDITSFGSFVFHFFLIVFFLALKQNNLAGQLIFAFLFTLVVTVIIRTFYFKDRPKKQTHVNFLEKIDAASFPSLHTARTVAMVLILIDFIQQNTVTVFLMSFSVLVIYSRVYLKKHDWDDVAGGIILGVITFFLALLV